MLVLLRTVMAGHQELSIILYRIIIGATLEHIKLILLSPIFSRDTKKGKVMGLSFEMIESTYTSCSS